MKVNFQLVLVGIGIIMIILILGMVFKSSLLFKQSTPMFTIVPESEVEECVPYTLEIPISGTGHDWCNTPESGFLNPDGTPGCDESPEECDESEGAENSAIEACNAVQSVRAPECNCPHYQVINNQDCTISGPENEGHYASTSYQNCGAQFPGETNCCSYQFDATATGTIRVICGDFVGPPLPRV